MQTVEDAVETAFEAVEKDFVDAVRWAVGDEDPTGDETQTQTAAGAAKEPAGDLTKSQEQGPVGLGFDVSNKKYGQKLPAEQTFSLFGDNEEAMVRYFGAMSGSMRIDSEELAFLDRRGGVFDDNLSEEEIAAEFGWIVEFVERVKADSSFVEMLEVGNSCIFMHCVEKNLLQIYGSFLGVVFVGNVLF